MGQWLVQGPISLYLAGEEAGLMTLVVPSYHMNPECFSPPTHKPFGPYHFSLLPAFPAASTSVSLCPRAFAVPAHTVRENWCQPSTPAPSCWKEASTNALVDKFPSFLSPQMGKLWDTGAKYSPQTDVSLGSVHYGCMICTEIESKHLRNSIVISQSSYRSPAPNNKKW